MAPSGTEPFIYQWFRGTEVGSGIMIDFATDETFETLPLTKTRSFWVRVTNPCGTVDSSTATATVVCDAPRITKQPISSRVPSGGSAPVAVVASGTNPISYQWYRGASGDISNPIDGANFSTYEATGITETMSYWVRLTNPCGSIDSDTAIVAVSRPRRHGVRRP